MKSLCFLSALLINLTGFLGRLVTAVKLLLPQESLSQQFLLPTFSSGLLVVLVEGEPPARSVRCPDVLEREANKCRSFLIASTECGCARAGGLLGTAVIWLCSGCMVEAVPEAFAKPVMCSRYDFTRLMSALLSRDTFFPL